MIFKLSLILKDLYYISEPLKVVWSKQQKCLFAIHSGVHTSKNHIWAIKACLWWDLCFGLRSQAINLQLGTLQLRNGVLGFAMVRLISIACPCKTVALHITS